jgi:hypothetical protein
MHETDPTGCIPVALCYSNNGAVDPSQPKMDDHAALSRLYPVTAQNLPSFTGSRSLHNRRRAFMAMCFSMTARVHRHSQCKA